MSNKGALAERSMAKGDIYIRRDKVDVPVAQNQLQIHLRICNADKCHYLRHDRLTKTAGRRDADRAPETLLVSR
jgi:hypothetical protein